MVTKGGCQGWFQQRTNLEKTLLSLSCVLIVTLLLLILVGIAVKGPNSEDVITIKGPGCWSTECIKSAGRILSDIDEKVDPCFNFYEYSCGDYVQTPQETSSKAQNSIDSVYSTIKGLLEATSDSGSEDFETAKSLYKSCMTFDGIHRERKETAQTLLKLMENYGVGTWPVLNGEFDDSDMSHSERLTALLLVGVPVAFRMDIVPDSQIEGAYLLKLSPGGPMESGRNSSEILRDQDLRKYMLFSFLLLGTSNFLKATKAVNDILDVDARYAKVEQDTKSRCDTIDILTPDESLQELSKLFPEMDWDILLSRIQQESGLQRPFAIELHCKAKIKEYLLQLTDVVSGTTNNYLGWRFYQSFAKHIEPAPQRSPSSLDGTVPRWKECVLLLEKYATPLLAQQLTQQEDRTEVGTKIQHLTMSFRTAAEHAVSNSGWLKSEQKSKILQQVKSVELQLPFVKSANRSIKFPKVSKDNYTAAVIELRKQWIIQRLKMLNPQLVSEETSHLSNSHLTSHATRTSESSLAIYFDQLHEPYLNMHGSSWMNYGGLGTFLAKKWNTVQLSEVLKSTPYTSIKDLWFDAGNTSSCLYNLLTHRFGFNSQAQKEKVLKEMFIEISSLEIAYESARNGAKMENGVSLPGLLEKSNEQMFYIAYTQTLCESKKAEKNPIPVGDRVNMIVANSAHFERVFSCPSTTTPKCHIWS